MKTLLFKIVLFTFIQFCVSPLFSQNAEYLKVALVHKIANCVVWKTDTTEYFTIGVLSNNPVLINKFVELSKITKINNKSIRIVSFSSIETIRFVHLLYIEDSYNQSFASISQKIATWNILLVSEEHRQPGEIMVNLKIEKRTSQFTFEYNRANILFAGLELTDKIVLLKGSEIEIRELYLQAKKLWDEQKHKVDSLEIKSLLQNINFNIQKDSILAVKKNVAENKKIIDEQIKIISNKDSISVFMNTEIEKQQAEMMNNKLQIENLMNDRNTYKTEVSQFRQTVGIQKKLSDSLANDIRLQKHELTERTKKLGEKETIIQKQSNWLLILFLFIVVVLISVLIIIRAYIINKKARRQIAEQKEELESVLENLTKTQQQLVQSEKMASLGVLVAGVAHEINNPMNFIKTGIAGFKKLFGQVVSLLSELNKINPESTKQDIDNLLELKGKIKLGDSIELMPKVFENIDIGINRTIEITNGLRHYARMDKEEKSLHNINEIIDTSLLLLKSKIANRIEIIKNYEAKASVLVFPGKLSQVFINIISNAEESMSENKESINKPCLTINTKEINEKITIEFSDTGAGIPQKNLNKIFDPFFTTKDVGKGTGLGLAITKGIIEEHQGVIYAKNNPVKGVTFIIELPLKK